jgi:hypothetical protein
MNAYIASFMLLLFNAVGLAVPASAAAEERMIPDLQSASNLSETPVSGQCAAVDPSHLGTFDHQLCAVLGQGPSLALPAGQSNGQKQVWTIATIRFEAGDKLEHEEGAP